MERAIPQYQMVKNVIKGRILRGDYKAGVKIPSENDFVKEFKVSKHTILNALSELIKEKLIYRQQGKGTFVAELDRELKKQVAVIVYRSDSSYYSKIVRSIEKEMTANSFNTILANSDGDARKETGHIERLIGSVDAFIIAPVTEGRKYSEGVKNIINLGFPLTFISNILDEDAVNRCVNYVVPDNSIGGFLAGEHLVACGYESFRFLMHRNALMFDPVRERLKGFKFALAHNEIAFTDNMIIETSDYDARNGYEKDGYMAAEKMRTNGKTVGIFALGDSLAIGLMRALKEKGVEIPEQVGICGFDDIDLARQWGVELTTIAQRKKGTGIKAAQLTLNKIKNISSNIEHITEPVEIIKRNSTVACRDAVAV